MGRIILWVDDKRQDSLAQLQRTIDRASPEEKVRIARDLWENEARLRRWLEDQDAPAEKCPLLKLLNAGPAEARSIIQEACGMEAELEEKETGSPSGLPPVFEHIDPQWIATRTDELDRIVRRHGGGPIRTLYLWNRGTPFILDWSDNLTHLRLTGYEAPHVYLHPRRRGQALDLEQQDLVLERLLIHRQGVSLTPPGTERIRNCRLIPDGQEERAIQPEGE